MQRDWIGRSEGAQIAFAIEGADEVLQVFTTRPETLWGATYCVLAPEHPLVPKIAAIDRRSAVMAYVEASGRKSEHERSERAGDKSGVFTGGYAINPANGAKLPVWVADYVLMGYGKGAIMAVPGHDSRDHAFARAFDLPIVRQGMILAFSYRDAAGKYYEPEKVTERDGCHFAGDVPVSQKIDKMSKSRFNVVNPDDVVEAHGADSLRLYEMFIGPLEMTKPWQTTAVHGMRHFLERVWRLVCDDDAPCNPRLVDVRSDARLLRLQHKTVRAVTEGIESLRFNTSIARLMSW
jgi:leucyl-tRNA synthetase